MRQLLQGNLLGAVQNRQRGRFVEQARYLSLSHQPTTFGQHELHDRALPQVRRFSQEEDPLEGPEQAA